MQKQIILENQLVNFTLKVSKKARSIRLSVYQDGCCVVTIPARVRIEAAEHFMHQKSAWILKKIHYYQQLPEKKPYSISTHHSKADLKKYKDQTRQIVTQKIAHFNTFYNFNVGRISIRNQRSRWGSCSRKGNLNFNYRIALLPDHLADYIVVHELCHLGQFNHSQKFWDLVSKTIPKYKEYRRELRG